MSQGNCIVIKTASSSVRTITKRDGTKVQFNEQTAALEVGEDFPKPFKFTLDDNQPPYAAGRYMIDPASLEVGDYDALRVGRRVKLVPYPVAPTGK